MLVTFFMLSYFYKTSFAVSVFYCLVICLTGCCSTFELLELSGNSHRCSWCSRRSFPPASLRQDFSPILFFCAVFFLFFLFCSQLCRLLCVCRRGKVLKGQRAIQRPQGQISGAGPVGGGEAVVRVLGPLGGRLQPAHPPHQPCVGGPALLHRSVLAPLAAVQH